MAKKKYRERTPDEIRIDKFLQSGFEKYKKRDYYGELKAYAKAFAEFECIRAEIQACDADCESELTCQLGDDEKRKKLVKLRNELQGRLNALELDKARIYMARAFSNFSLGRFNEALEDCSAVLRLEPRNIIAYERRGLAKQALKDYAGAMKDFDTVLRYYPKDRNTLSDRGLLKIKLGKVDSAMRDFAKGIRYATRWKEDVYTNRGIAFAILKKYKRAIADHNRALKINPKFGSAYNNRGYCKYFLGDLAGAKKDCDKAHSLDKACPNFKKARKIFQES